MKRIRVKIVMQSGQSFTTHVDKDKLCEAYKKREPDFEKMFLIEPTDLSKDPCFMINGKYVESITLTEIS